MKISTKILMPPPYVRLDSVHEGHVVRFHKVFSEHHRPDDLFIVNIVCNSYVPDCIKRRSYCPADRKKDIEHGDRYDRHIHLHPHESDYWGGSGVTNLRTGRLSYVDGTRQCVLMDAELQVAGEL